MMVKRVGISVVQKIGGVQSYSFWDLTIPLCGKKRNIKIWSILHNPPPPHFLVMLLNYIIPIVIGSRCAGYFPGQIHNLCW